MYLKKKINFIPVNIDPDTLNNCAICGEPITTEDQSFICASCATALKWYMEATNDNLKR